MSSVSAVTGAPALLAAGLLVASSGLLPGRAAAGQGLEPATTSTKALRQGPAAAGGEGTPRGGDPAQRARELIYLFRNHRVFSRDEEWARTIRELAVIGKDAVPELVAELDRTDRDATLRSLGFTLRAIGDPRAVPALIRAIPKALRPPGSDCGVQIIDADLRAFMRTHQDYKDDQSESVAVGRPVNEILTALERITGHGEFLDSAGKDVRHLFLGGTPEQQAGQRASFDQCRQRWEAWWSTHGREFVTQEELRSVELPRRNQDLVEAAGAARYGRLFPTGPDVRLGPVRMLRLAPLAYANGRSHLDFDTGRTFALFEGLKAADWADPSAAGLKFTTWYWGNGIDARCQGPIEGSDLLLWLIDNSRWDTLEAEVQKAEPLPLGREATSTMKRFDETWTDYKPNELATFLFTTREGGRGVVQVFPKDPDVDRTRIRYRMWTTAQAAPSARVIAGTGRANSLRTLFGPTVTTTLEPPAKGRQCLLNLETSAKLEPPDFLLPHEMANPYSLARHERFARWCREQGPDLLGRSISGERRGKAVPAGPAGPFEARAHQPRAELAGLEMTAERILPHSFDDLTVEEARELLERTPNQKQGTAWINSADYLTERPDTFAFQTREGTVGLLQFHADPKNLGKLTIRYRLESRDKPVGRR